MSNQSRATPSDPNQLCLKCGMCCNGVIFADVKLQPGDNPALLKSFGLSITGTEHTNSKPKFSQPCAALDGCRCQIYPHRPQHCRQFECVLFKNVKAGRLKSAAAMQIIRAAQARVRRLNQLLGKLGDVDEQASLRARFRRTVKRLEQADLHEKTAQTYGQLTLAMHDLDLLLGEAFYPG